MGLHLQATSPSFESDSADPSSPYRSMNEQRQQENDERDVEADPDSYQNVTVTETQHATVVDETTEEEPQSLSRSCSAYCKSSDFRELIACFIFALLCFAIYLGSHKLLRIRSIPVQYLQNSKEYVVNLSYNEPLVDETVSSKALILSTLFAPWVLQLLLSYYRGMRGDTHGTGCVYLVAFGLTHLATESIKLYVGYLRPIFLQVCNATNNNYQNCSGDNNASSARMSFVSGHASTSMCGMMLFFLYLHYRFGVPSALAAVQERRWKGNHSHQAGSVSNDNEEGGRGSSCCSKAHSTTSGTTNMYKARLVSMLALLPLAVAVFIAASRVADNRHFPADVVGGSLLGGAISYFVHGLWL
jgi:membrane-associated phospholipid phosphatase